MNPLAVLRPALYTALTSPALLLAGADVPVGEYFPGAPGAAYVEIDQPTDTDAGGSAGCRQFSCTALLNVVTQFNSVQVSGNMAETIVSQIHARLRGQVLPMPDGWQCGPGQLEPALQVKETNGEQTLVRRLLRYRWALYYHL